RPLLHISIPSQRLEPRNAKEANVESAQRFSTVMTNSETPYCSTNQDSTQQVPRLNALQCAGILPIRISGLLVCPASRLYTPVQVTLQRLPTHVTQALVKIFLRASISTTTLLVLATKCQQTECRLEEISLAR